MSLLLLLRSRSSGHGLQLTAITGAIYSATTGLKRTSGRLYFRPRSFINVGTELVSTARVFVDIPASGDLSFSLAPSNTVLYDVEFDPDPSNVTTPLKLKSGYFKNVWKVPEIGPVNLATL